MTAASAAAAGSPVRIGMLVPSSNSNAEPLTNAILASLPEVELFASRFRLPPALSDVIDRDLLSGAVGLLADVTPDVVAFHGTSGSWTGIARDGELADWLRQVAGASAGTTATQAMLAAIRSLGVTRISIAFPGTPAIVSGISAELGRHGVEVVGSATLPADLTNPQIAALGPAAVEELLSAAVLPGAEAILCVGTNLRAAYLVEQFERQYGLPVIDSAVALAWHVLRLGGLTDKVPGWGALLAHH